MTLFFQQSLRTLVLKTRDFNSIGPNENYENHFCKKNVTATARQPMHFGHISANAALIDTALPDCFNYPILIVAR